MTIEAVTYTPDGVTTHERIGDAREADGTTWVRAVDADPAELNHVAEAFGLHPLTVEDVRNAVRPKTEEFEEYTFVLLRTAFLVHGETTFEEEIADDPFGLFVGDDWLVTLATTTIGPVDRAWNALDRGDTRILRRGPDFLAYRIIDGLTDDYFAVLDRIEDQIERVEEAVVTSTDRSTLEAINSVRRELLSFRKLLWPSREALATLSRGDPDQIQDATEKYFRDVYDHLVQLVDLTETYRDLVSGARDIYLNSLSISTNEVMKRLTVVATIILPLTFVAGVYGMNFEGGPYNMPELAWTYGYPAVMLGMLGVAVILLVYFRREEWL